MITVLFWIGVAVLAIMLAGFVALLVAVAIHDPADGKPEAYQPRHRHDSIREPYAGPEVVEPHYDPDTDQWFGEDWSALSLISGEWETVAPLWTEELAA